MLSILMRLAQVAAMTMLLAACAEFNGPVFPPLNSIDITESPVMTQERLVSGFTKVSVSGVGELILVQDGTETLTITAEEHVLPLVRSEVVGGRLILGPAPGANFQMSQGIDYRLSVRNLEELDVSGVMVVTASGLDADSLATNLRGTAIATLSGRADQQRLSAGGTIRCDASNLASRTVDARLTGTAWSKVRVTDLLTGHVSGNATLEYMGDPVVDATVSGNGSLRRR